MSAAGWPTRRKASGVEIYPGFACSEVLYRDDGSVRGVVAGVMGIAKDGSHKPDYQPGMELIGKYVFIAEGVRGSLAKEIIAKFDLSEGREPQKFGLGMKELWEVKPENHKQGQVTHTMGWPLGAQDRRRQLHVSPRRQSRVHRLRRPSQLPESAISTPTWSSSASSITR